MDTTPSNSAAPAVLPLGANSNMNNSSPPSGPGGVQLQPQLLVSGPAIVPMQYLQPQQQQVFHYKNQEEPQSIQIANAYVNPQITGRAPDPPPTDISASAAMPGTWKPAPIGAITSGPILPGNQVYALNAPPNYVTAPSPDTSSGVFAHRLEPADLQPIGTNLSTPPELLVGHQTLLPQQVSVHLPEGTTPLPSATSIAHSISNVAFSPSTLASNSHPQQQKRPHLPCPEDILESLRKPKKAKSGEGLSQTDSINVPFNISNEKFPSMAHSAPSSMIPIIPLRTGINDFYTDFPKVTDPNVHEQVQNILYQFPPPLPPASLPQFGQTVAHPTIEDFRHRYMNSSEDSGLENGTPNTSPTSTPRNKAEPIPLLEGGIYVPFIYPPPPIIKPTDLPYSLTKFKQTLELQRQQTYPNGTAEPIIIQKPANEYPELAPLPFPPSNYMPYPIHSDKGPLTPPEVIDSFMDALKYLPRVDMIVASAAGSLFELRNSSPDQVSHLAAKQYELRRKKESGDLNQLQLDDDNEEDKKADPELAQDDEDDEFAFLKHIDYQNYYHFDSDGNPVFPWSDPNANMVVAKNIPIDYLAMSSTLSNSRNAKTTPSKPILLAAKYDPFDDKQDELDSQTSHTGNDVDVSQPFPIKDLIPRINRDIASASGNFFLRRQTDLKDALARVENFDESHKFQLYHAKRRLLLEKLQDLRKSKIGFVSQDGDVLNPELQNKLNDLGVVRDTELIRQKLSDDYEKLKCSSQFYQDSNKAYKNLNITMVSKLQKLKNFFEYQRKILSHHLEDKLSEIFDIKSKESSKLFFGVNNDTDYTQVIKKTMRHKSESAEPEPNEEDYISQVDNDHTPDEILNSQDTTPFQDPHAISATLQSKSANALVHDLMPLITPTEFDLITGDLPNQVKNLTMKTKSADKISKSNLINVKHKIFQSALYDPLYTSGSDSNTSDSTAAGTGVVDRLVFNVTGMRNGGENTNNLSGAQSGNISTGGSGAGSATPKRRGRRAAASQSNNGGNLAPAGSKSVEDIDVTKYLEALLLARIMKHFQGPQSAKQLELNDDLEGMGITTRWPVK